MDNEDPAIYLTQRSSLSLQEAYLERLAYTYLQYNQPAKALILYQFLQITHPDNLHYILALAYTHLQLKQYINAEYCANRICEYEKDREKIKQISESDKKIFHFAALILSKTLWQSGKTLEAQAQLSLIIKHRSFNNTFSLIPHNAESN